MMVLPPPVPESPVPTEPTAPSPPLPRRGALPCVVVPEQALNRTRTLAHALIPTKSFDRTHHKLPSAPRRATQIVVKNRVLPCGESRYRGARSRRLGADFDLVLTRRSL